MNFKKILLLFFVNIYSTSFSQPTLRELWNDLKEEVKEAAEEVIDEVLNTEIEIIFEEEKKSKKTIRYAKNTEEAAKAFKKFERKYGPDCECLNSKNPRECLRKIVKAKLAHRSDDPYSDYFEELKAHNRKAVKDFELLNFFDKWNAFDTKEKLQELQTQYKELFKKELRERYQR
jgi:hypothetical protein